MALVPADSDDVQTRFLPMRDVALRMMEAQEQASQRKMAETFLQNAESLTDQGSWIEARIALQQALQLVPSTQRYGTP